MTIVIDKVIDPARVGLSKSLMTNPCERKGYYSETIRDESGRRLRGPMPEKVHFGAAVDSAHGYIVGRLRDGDLWGLEAAVTVGMIRAESGDWGDVVPDWETFKIQLANAIVLFSEQPDGLARLAPEIPGIRIQGDDGRSLAAEDVIGTPDYLFADGSVLDVKTAGAKFYVKKFLGSAEMPVYAFLAASEAGVVPPRLVYQIYVRIQKPYWQWIEVPGTPAHVALGRLHAARWRAGIGAGDPDLFGFDPTFCGDCHFRAPIPELGFDGCAVGMAVGDLAAEEVS